MDLVIDTRNGMAGDISCAGLIALGADPEAIATAMTTAGGRIGRATVSHRFVNGAVQLQIELEPSSSHMSESEALHHLEHVLDEIDISGRFRDIALSILDVMCVSERYVHSNDPRLKHMVNHHKENGTMHHYHKQNSTIYHTHKNSTIRHHHENSTIRHHHEDGNTNEAILHEAQDILMDIAGFVTGLKEFGIGKVRFIDHVNVGSGTISFSHGTFEVPAPATRYILDNHDIPWKKSNEYRSEMATPTGASILAGCKAQQVPGIANKGICGVGINGQKMDGKGTDGQEINGQGIDGRRVGGFKVVSKRKARGTKVGLPPLDFYLVR